MTPRRRKPEPMGLRKSERIRSQPHLQFVRGFRCCVSESIGLACSRKIHVHHVRSASNSGIGIKPPDSETVPLCAYHHKVLHEKGQPWFERIYMVDLEKIAAAIWAKSPARIKYERQQKKEPTP